jgi:hypothetical protein
MNYKEYYNYCKSIYKGIYTNKYPLNELTTLTHTPEDINFKFPKDYNLKIKNISKYVYNKLNTKTDLFDLEHKNIIKVNNFYDCKEIYELGNYFGEFLEQNTYNSPCIVEAVLIYQSLPNEVKRASWLWHYDNNVNEQIKLMVYLNDVNEDTGAFEILHNGQKGTKSEISIQGSRIPDSEIKKYLNKGYKIHPVIGPSGTFCIFDPNCIHRATTPKSTPYRLAMVYNFRPYHKNLNNRVNKSFTKTWSNLDNIKEFNTSIKI